MQGGIEIAESSPIVIPVFVPNLGCPHRCVFCDQSQFSEVIAPEDIPAAARSFLEGCRDPENRERLLAFYGGSFTGIERDLFERYVAEGRKLIEKGVVHGMKASTRPDMVTGEILEKCRDAGFVELEIGAQSMDDYVLDASRRGHTTSDTSLAVRLINDSGMRSVVQIMPGLPGEDRESFRNTVLDVARLRPHGVRVYPTVVFQGTELEDMYREGSYMPLGLDEAVLRCLFAYISFLEEGITVFRMGLPPSDGLRIAAGPYHPSFGFLVRSRAYMLMAGLLQERYGNGIELEVNPHDVPELIGYKRENLLKRSFSYSFDDRIPRGNVRVKGFSERGCLQPRDIIEYIL